MCLICIDFDRGALKPKEARRALSEMRSKLEPAHAREVERKLEAAEQAASSPAHSPPAAPMKLP